MIKMISDLFKEAKEDIVNLIELVKPFEVLGKTIIEIKNVPAMKIINELGEIITIIAIAIAVIYKFIMKKIKRH